MDKLKIDNSLVESCKEVARDIAKEVIDISTQKSTVSVERAILRLLGVKGADENDVPHVNRLVDQLREQGFLEDGIACHIGNIAVKNGMTLEEVIMSLLDGTVVFEEIDSLRLAKQSIDGECIKAWSKIAQQQEARFRLRHRVGENTSPSAYVLTATGDVYEDVRHSLAVANHGGDIVSVIRSTAQSLLDFVPYGVTREGYGGTYATQENFQVLRKALDEWINSNNRYVRLSSFSSGLCMPEIATMGAIEGLDNMVSDALYGILYRDINTERTLIDQVFSRMICASAGIVINTGEDNYLRTANPIEAAPSVVVSQMINFEMAKLCRVPVSNIGIGNAFEIPPDIENGLLLEWSQALLTRQLFKDSPVKFMPPTRYMDGNIFKTHACDTLFNLVTVATNQGIQTIGVPTEGIFTPHIQDRVIALENVAYIKKTARNLYDEIEFKEDGLVQKRACEVLSKAESIIREIHEGEQGLFGAIERGLFGDVKRDRQFGKGRDGVFNRSELYLNPFEEIFKGGQYAVS